jgi:hypothetical protein
MAFAPVFTELVTDLLEDEDYQQMQEHLLIYPTAGDVIVGTAGCRFLLAYDHRSVDDLTPAQKRQLADIVRQLK